MSNKNYQSILWLLVIISPAISIMGVMPSAIAFAGLVSAIGTFSRCVFAFIHGSQHLGWRNIFVMFCITCVVSWCYESLSIATGFPFGHYVYTSHLGLKLGTVPLEIMPAYFGVCYLAWVLSHVLLDRFSQKIDSKLLFAIPIVAAFVMAMWDMTMDPHSATVEHAWIWRDGGGYFGVPFSNFLGWYLCVFTIFQLWAIYLKHAKQGGDSSLDDLKSSWYLPVLFYASISLEALAAASFTNDGTVVDAASQVWSLKALYQTLGLVSIFTMVFVSCLAFIKVRINAKLR